MKKSLPWSPRRRFARTLTVRRSRAVWISKRLLKRQFVFWSERLDHGLSRSYVADILRHPRTDRMEMGA
ncbi:hypothetical protein [Antarcticirhabdus aurantiaca]|uniref:Uncharacterized protein n=1 Tax=Antarcticirhabdus aurantiaca TaxID=2606717 RepID=A0ACD4NWC7_9HYPH|nr:hypothetical protein [Antarcticirhabdus aurantiaca]WAJ31291.1 hypothetical protein OXU80_14265 [Jeongeuplla avenae]